MFEVNYPLKLTPDWAMPDGVYLIWPGTLNSYIDTPEVIDDYLSLISAIPREMPVHILAKNTSKIKKMITHFSERRARFIVNRFVSDIWIKGFAPIPAVNMKGEKVLVKARYAPRYIKPDEAAMQDECGIGLSRTLGRHLVDIPLVWDMGNVTHNGNGTAIVTERLFSDNAGCSRKEIFETFRHILGVAQLVVVDEFPGDITGHIDWLVRFMDPVTVAVASFPRSCERENRFMDGIVAEINRAMSPWVKVVRVMNSMLFDTADEKFPNCFGNHMNFLRLGPSRIIVPVYGVGSDDIAIKDLKRRFPRYHIIPVRACAIAMQGGVFNCMTWVCA